MRILLGITGSVAATLTPKLVQKLIEYDNEVIVVASTPALYFLPPEKFNGESLSITCHGNASIEVPVYIDKDEWPVGGYHRNDPVKHIDFRNWADIFLIAPLSANTLAKINNGIADNFLCCIARAWVKSRPIILAPAMNTEMWVDSITEKQLQELGNRYQKLKIIYPVEKRLACGDVGLGAMADIDEIAKIAATTSLI